MSEVGQKQPVIDDRFSAAKRHQTGQASAYMISTAYELPQFDTGQYEGCEFRMRGGDASLAIRVAEFGTIDLTFRRVRWHQFVALSNCTAEMVDGAYFRLIEIRSSELAAFVAADTGSRKAYSALHHYRIFLDGTGCHEGSRSPSVPDRPAILRSLLMTARGHVKSFADGCFEAMQSLWYVRAGTARDEEKA